MAKDTKTERLELRVTSEQKAKILKQAKAQGLKASELVRRAVLDGTT